MKYTVTECTYINGAMHDGY